MNCPFCQNRLIFYVGPDNYKSAMCLHDAVNRTTIGIWAFLDNKTDEFINYFLNFPMDNEVYGFDMTFRENLMSNTKNEATFSVFKGGSNNITPFLTIHQNIDLLPSVEDYQKLFKRYLNLKAFL